MTFASPSVLLIAAIISATAVLIAWRRRVALSGATILFAILGMILLTLAAGDPILRWTSPPKIAVMIDVSASTRGASYLDRMAVQTRLNELLGAQPYELHEFGKEIPPEKTTFAPPPADALVLFSDCQFDLPTTAPPTFIVVDPNLETPRDARVARLEFREKRVAANIDNDGAPRELAWAGADSIAATAPTGSTVQIAQRLEDASEVRVQLAPSDRWPENDSLSIRASPPINFQRWWIGRRDPGTPWFHLSASDLPRDKAAYLAPSIIVLDNVSARALSTAQLSCLEQYARDLGGALLILGGDHAFAAGAYTGTSLELLSPLSSDPPGTTTHWILLADSSGSMSAPATDGKTRWQLASATVIELIKSLPPEDLLSVGSFARELHWWSNGIRAGDGAALAQPMAKVQPNGPTNLQATLEQLAALNSSMPTELLILTDAQAMIDNPSALAQTLAAKHIRVNVLALVPVADDSPLRKIASATGGTWRQQADAGKWLTDARELLRAAAPDRIDHAPARVEFTGALSTLSPRRVDLSNRTWLKRDATELAHADDRAMVARWKAGAGEVLAAAFTPMQGAAQAMVDLIARTPRDPRFEVIVDPSSKLRIAVDAIDQKNYLNELPLVVELNSKRIPMPQIAPGRYEVELDAPREPAFVTIRNGDQLLDRVAVAGRYAPEFDAIGNNRQKMRALAERTGGAVIAPDQKSPIQFAPLRAIVPIARFLALAAALCVTLALISWKRGGLTLRARS